MVLRSSRAASACFAFQSTSGMSSGRRTARRGAARNTSRSPARRAAGRPPSGRPDQVQPGPREREHERLAAADRHGRKGSRSPALSELSSSLTSGMRSSERMASAGRSSALHEGRDPVRILAAYWRSAASRCAATGSAPCARTGASRRVSRCAHASDLRCVRPSSSRLSPAFKPTDRRNSCAVGAESPA